MHKGFGDIREEVALHNGDHPIRVLFDGKDDVYVVQQMAGPPRSCLHGRVMTSQPIEFFFPTDARLLPLVFVVSREEGCLPMDTLDWWQMNLNRLPIDTSVLTLTAQEALERMNTLLRARLDTVKVETLPAYAKWTRDPMVMQRWNKQLDARRFLLDLVQHVIGAGCVERLCDRMGMTRPLHSLMQPSPEDSQIENKPPTATPGRKKGKLSAEDFKGHKSLASFFKKAVSAPPPDMASGTT